MILSRRERLIAVVLLSAVGLLVVDRYVWTPVAEYRDELAADRAEALRELERATRLFRDRREHARSWNEMLAAGVSDDPGAAESRLLHQVREWAAESGLTLSSVRPARETRDPRFHRITLHATGTGNMRSVSQFLWRLERAETPLNVSEVQLSSRRDGQDDLMLTIRISTLFLNPEPPEERRTVAPVRVTQGRLTPSPGVVGEVR
jgi:Tfp pilus assembly protein PilO